MNKEHYGWLKLCNVSVYCARGTDVFKLSLPVQLLTRILVTRSALVLQHTALQSNSYTH